MIADILTQLGAGVLNFGTSFVQTLYAMFTGLFFETAAEGGTMTLNVLGQTSLAFVALGLVLVWTKTVAGWLKLRSKSGKRGSRKKKAA